MENPIKNKTIFLRDSHLRGNDDTVFAYSNSYKKLAVVICAVLLFSCHSNGKYTTPAKENTAPLTGKKVFETYCVACHGADGKMGFSGAKDLSVTQFGIEDRIKIITHGKGVMNPFKDVLSAEEIRKVAIYIDSIHVN